MTTADIASVAMTVLTVWLLVYGARRTDAPWWKIWLLARGIVPTWAEIQAAEERYSSDRGAASAGDRSSGSR